FTQGALQAQQEPIIILARIIDSINVPINVPASAATGIVNLAGGHVVWQSCGIDTPAATTKYKNHRFPVEIISHAVWLLPILFELLRCRRARGWCYILVFIG